MISFRTPTVARRVAQILLPLLLLSGTTAAAIGDGYRTSASQNDLAYRVFQEAYQHIVERHIEKVNAEQVALTGLRGLSKLDQDLQIKRAGGVIRLLVHEAAVGEFVPADSRSVNDWAALTVEAIAAARNVSPKLRNLPEDEIYEAFFGELLSSLDKYSRYSSASKAENNRAQREGFGGVGIRVQVDQGVTKVVSVIPQTPAEKAGLKVDDTITGIDGQPVRGMELLDVVNRLRGPRGSDVRLSIDRPGARNFDVTVWREHIIAHAVHYRPEGDVAYIRIDRFNQSTAADVAKALKSAETDIGPNFSGVILDLRNNPGGLLDQAVAVSDMFLRNGRIVSTEGRHPGSFQSYDAGAGEIAAGKPLVVLVNGRSASSSEIVAAALQDQGRAVVVGSNSYGKGTVQSVFRLPNNGELTLTWSRFHAPSGYTIEGLGIMPNVCTSSGKGVPPTVLANLRESKVSEGIMRKWHQLDLVDESARMKLREACPQQTANTDELDIQVAQSLLRQPTLYRDAAASAQAGTSSYAARPLAGSAGRLDKASTGVMVPGER